jgi:GNAT superfamily N-acetyltransferase
MESSFALSVGTHAVGLRPVGENDSAFLRAVYASTRDEELAMVSWIPAEKDQFLQMQFEAQDRFYRENYPGAEFWVILVDRQPAGRLYLHYRAEDIRIMDIALLPNWRGRGIGTALLSAVIEQARAGGRRASIHVEVFNPARRLYGRLGFRPVSKSQVHILMEWRPAAPMPNG